MTVSCAHKMHYNTVEVSYQALASTYARNPASVENKANVEYTDLLVQCYQDDSEKIPQKLRKLAEKNSNDYWYWIALGNCNSYRERFSAAYIAFKKAVALATSKQKKEVVYANLLALAMKKDNIFVATSYVQQLKSIGFKEDITFYNLALYHLMQREYHQAEISINKISKQGQNDLDIIIAKAKIQISLKHYAKASKVLEKVPLAYQQRSDVGILYGYTLIQLNQLKHAENVLEDIEVFKADEKVIAVRYLNLIQAKLKAMSKQDS